MLLDANLKGKYSYDAAKALRDRGVPIVFISGYDPLPDCPPMLETIPRLTKPFRMKELATAIEDATAAQ